MRSLFPLLASVILFLSCSDEQEGQVFIRVMNQSIENYDNVVVQSPSNTINYGNIKAGEFSKYERFDKAYRYGYIEVTVDGQQLFLQPIDYVGETPLKEGKYTYEVGLLSDSQGNLTSLSLYLADD